jgi:hypothetical protein
MVLPGLKATPFTMPSPSSLREGENLMRKHL